MKAELTFLHAQFSIEMIHNCGCILEPGCVAQVIEETNKLSFVVSMHKVTYGPVGYTRMPYCIHILLHNKINTLQGCTHIGRSMYT